MKLIIIMKLADQLVSNMLYPISKIREIENIFIVRENYGPNIEKVHYITPWNFGALSSLFKIPLNFLQLIKICFIEKPSLIHAFLLFPHGYLALIAGKLTGNKVGVSLIAGPVETYIFGGSPIGLFPYCCSLQQSTKKKS